MSGMEQLASAIHTPDSQDAHTFTGAIVQGVNEDGTVDVRYLGGYHSGIECLSSYTNRLAGDNVMIRDSGSRWTVLGKLGAEANSSPNISWGTGSPVGSDWETAASVKVRPGQLYVQGTAFAASNKVPTVQPILTPTDMASYQSNLSVFLAEGAPVQGVETITGMYGSGDWRGAWFYGSNLSTAAAAKTVTSMELFLARSEAAFGIDGKVTPKLYLHNHTTNAGSLTTVDGPYLGPDLEIGESAWWRVPQAVIDQLVANTAKGFAIRSDVSEDFMAMSLESGLVRITN